MSGYAKWTEYEDVDMQNHIASVWMVFLVLSGLFTLFTGTLLVYHTYLLMSGQTTWEHSRRNTITYLAIYPVGILPFYKGIWENIKIAFCHGGKCREWSLQEPYELKEEQGFNICENEYYSCC